MQLIMGSHPIQELLTHAPDRLVRLYTTRREGDIVRAFEKAGLPISIVSNHELNRMVDSDSHQSLVAQVKDRKYYDVKEFLEKTEEEETTFVLMLDQIFDPQNFGALIRSAECFGLSGVAWSKNRGSDLTPVAAKTSSGASELIDLIRVANLADAVTQFQKGGFEVVAALLDEKAESAYTFKYSPKTVLIVGSEGEGIQPLIRKKADRAIYLPMKGKIQSLNVAQATAALLALNVSSAK